MGLDLLPRPINDDDKKLPRGMTHAPSEPCPFVPAHNPIGIFGTCCSFRGAIPSLYLHGLSHYALAFYLYVDKTPEEARQLARRLRDAVKQTEEITERAREESGAPRGPADKLTVAVAGVGWEFRLDDATGVIVATATWLEQVADLGFGVEAWS